MSCSTEDNEEAYNNTNAFPRLSTGHVLHLHVKEGDVANRVLSVGSSSRAKKIAALLDQDRPINVHTSSRGFTVYSGTYRSISVSIIATNMGIANMDFVVREARSIVSGPMAIVRFGTCGGLHSHLSSGSIVTTNPGSIMLRRNPDAFHINSTEDHYTLSRMVPSDSELSTLLMNCLRKEIKDESKLFSALNVTACSFYSSQGRSDPNFEDFNESLHHDLLKQVPEAGTMEMETFHLLDLARCSKGTIRAAAAVIVLANRPLNQVASEDTLASLEFYGGKAMLDALTQLTL